MNGGTGHFAAFDDPLQHRIQGRVVFAFAQHSFDLVEVDLDSSQYLAQLIVDLARDSGAFLFARGLQPGGEGAKLTPIFLEGFLGAAAFGDVGDATDGAYGFAVGVPDDVAAVQDEGV